MKRIGSALLALVAAVPSTAATGSTPRPEDIPKPEPVVLGLAGDPRPDVLRYLYVQTAIDSRDPVTEADAFVEGVRSNGARSNISASRTRGTASASYPTGVMAYHRVAAFLEKTLAP